MWENTKSFIISNGEYLIGLLNIDENHIKELAIN
jgi:hypothetical protein